MTDVNNKIIRGFVFSPNANDTTSFYRGVYVWQRFIKDKFPNLFADAPLEVTLADTMKYDFAFMQRPFNNEGHLKLARMWKHMDVPLWIDYDDDLFTVQEDNPAYKIYSQEVIKQSVRDICQAANVITVSTQHLVDVYKPYNKNVVLVPNAFDATFAPKREPKPLNKIVLWRGSDTHFLDLMSVSDELKAIVQQHKDWVFIFWGYNPTWLTTKFTNCHFRGGVDIKTYFKTIKNFAASVNIFPLEFNDFNKAKSCNAWVEGSYGGGASLVADYPEWQKPGLLTYKTPEDFKTKLSDLINGKYDIMRLNTQSWNYIKENLFLSKINEIRKEILTDLLDGKYK